MPPQFRRFAPLLVIGLLLLVLLPLLRHSKKSSISDADRARHTKHALTVIDSGEQRYAGAHGGRYTSHLADLVPASKGLAGDLAVGLLVELDVSSNGRTYVAQVESSVLSLVRARTGARLDADTCLVLKSSSGVNCGP